MILAAVAAQRRRYGGEALSATAPFRYDGPLVLEMMQRDKERGTAKGIVAITLDEEALSEIDVWLGEPQGRKV